MSTTAYNIIWADDEIDALLDLGEKEYLEKQGFNIIKAHNGRELESLLNENMGNVDAVIVDANFSESLNNTKSERETSGLTYSRNLYRIKLNCKIPFFLYTNRSDELLRDIYKDNSELLEDFPRHKRWFSKSGAGEYKKMFDEIKAAVEETKSTSFIIRNKYKYELNAASVFEGTKEFIFEFLIHEHENRLEEMVEPFVRVRKALERMFDMCAKLKLMPPINEDMNGTADYFKYSNYCPKNKDGMREKKYEMIDKGLMPKPIANSLAYIVDIVQDGSHDKNCLKLKVDKYFYKSKDTLLLRSVVYILIDCIKWFTVTALNHKDSDANEALLWEKV